MFHVICITFIVFALYQISHDRLDGEVWRPEAPQASVIDNFTSALCKGKSTVFRKVKSTP